MSTAQPASYTHYVGAEGRMSVEGYLVKNGLSPRSVFTVFAMSPPRYLVFPDSDAYWAWAKTQPVQTYCEVVPDGPQRLKFDIDADAAALQRAQIADTHPNVPEYANIPSSSPRFTLLCAIVIESICDMFCTVYGFEPKLIICESTDKRRPVKKYSRHIIVDGFYVSDAANAREFTRLVVQVLPEAVRRFVDQSVNKTLQTFRLVGSTKPGEDRIKRILTDHEPDDTILTNVGTLLPLADITHTATPTVRMTLPDNGEIERIFAEAGLATHHRFRCRRGNSYIYNRIAPSYCEFCKRVHSSDNTLLVTTHPSAEGVVDVRVSCRRYTAENGSAKTRKIGEYVGVCEGEEVETYAAHSRLERAVTAAATPRSGGPLFADCPITAYSEPSLRPFELCETLVVHAAMKMGKTKTLRNYLTRYFPADTPVPRVVRFVSFRRTFSGNIGANFPDFTLYSDIKGAVLNQPRLIVQVESLHRLEITETPPDLLVLDECESIFEQFESGLIRRFSQTCATFIYLLRHSKHVVCMDANITVRTENILRRIRARPIHYHRNSYANATDYNYRVTASHCLWAAMLDKAIGDGERVAVPVASLKFANALYDTLRRRHTDKAIMLYSSETDQSVKTAHFADVNQWWSKYDVVIYTPTVTAGVSFETRHFDRVFGYFTSASCGDLSCIQMLGRIRDVAKREIILCIKAIDSDHPTDPDEIVALYYSRRQCLFSENNGLTAEYNAAGELVLVKTPYFHIWVENMRARNLSRNDFANRLLAIVAQTGAKIGYMAPVQPDSPLAEAVRSIREELVESEQQDTAARNAAIAEADDVEDPGAIRDKLDAGLECTAGEINSLRKHALREHYRYNGQMTPEWVRTYGARKVRDQYTRLCQIGAGDTATIARIRLSEAASYTANMQLDEKYHYVDIKRQYVYVRHRIAYDLLTMCGFANIHDTNYVHSNTLSVDQEAAHRLAAETCREFEWAIPGRQHTRDAVIGVLFTLTQRVLDKMYGIGIERAGDSMYRLRPPAKFAPGEPTAPMITPTYPELVSTEYTG